MLPQSDVSLERDVMRIPLLDEIRDDPAYYLSRALLLTFGTLISAFSVVVFLLPSSIAPSGATGLAVILRELLDTPIGLVILLANIPVQLIAFRVLNGWKTVTFTIYAVLLYAGAIEALQMVLEDLKLTDDAFLAAVCGGVMAGVGGGLIYRAGGTIGGTSTIAQMLRRHFGIPLSAASLTADTLVIGLAGMVLGWEPALYAFITVFVMRIASDYMLEGPRAACTAIIITEFAEEIHQALAASLQQPVITWNVRGAQENASQELVMVMLLRSQTHELQHVIRDVDDQAFVTVLTSQEIYGEGFQSVHAKLPLRLDEVES
jgi:uncharacterized membrane-anchored protein YitT (DUF2179 family)